MLREQNRGQASVPAVARYSFRTPPTATTTKKDDPGRLARLPSVERL